MFEIVERNVNHAWVNGVRLLKQCGIKRSSRNGDVLELSSGCVTRYLRPTERVLFCAVRDANPFFHLFEALWILAGRDDVEFPSQFASQLRQYSDDGKTFHAAYGHRMRKSHVGDQLKLVECELKEDPTSRRAVVAIWDAEKDLHIPSRDIPCNTHLYFKIDHNGHLRMTVCNRSNDIVWGLYGANVVHWSMVMEYVAASIGVPVGSMTTVSDSFHAYISNPTWEKLEDGSRLFYRDLYEGGQYAFGPQVGVVPLVNDPGTFFDDLERFLADPLDELSDMFPRRTPYSNAFFWRVAEPMYLAWVNHRSKKNGHLILREVNREAEEKGTAAIDWLVAGEKWLERREAPVRQPVA